MPTGSEAMALMRRGRPAEALGPVSLKGKSGPVEVYAVSGG